MCTVLTLPAGIDEVPALASQAAPRPAQSLAEPAAMFALVSWGCAGSKWLSVALNAHPDVFCLHSANYYLQSMMGARLLDGVDYLYWLEAIGCGHRVCGDVHGVSRETIPALAARYAGRFATAALVRDPLPRFRSQVALSLQLGCTGSWEPAHIHHLANLAGLEFSTLSEHQRAALHAAGMLNAIVEEAKLGPIYRIEDLSWSRQQLTELLEHISHGRAVATDAWLDHVLALPPQNRHAQHAPLSPEDRRIIDCVLLPEARERYEALGYRLA